MNPAHLHLVTNHIPVIGSYAALLVLAWGLARKSDEVVRVGLLGFVVVGLAAAGVQLTGEGAEEVVERLATVTHDSIEEHEEAALFSTIVLGVAGALGLLALFLSHRRGGPARALTLATLVAGALGAAVVTRTAVLGGQINHPEIRQGAAAGQPGAGGEDDDEGRRGRGRG